MAGQDLGRHVALVTGASRGIGGAIATLLAARGAHVVAGAREQNAAATVAAVQAAGGRADLATLDVTDPKSVDAVVAGTQRRRRGMYPARRRCGRRWRVSQAAARRSTSSSTTPASPAIS